jgi:8-oxo-dGTP pyrophosphatase MutT (NUDIX family)
MAVREDYIERPDGSTGIYGVVDKPDFVLIIPVQGGGFCLVEQYRYPVRGRFWEFPQGSWPEIGTTGSADHAVRPSDLPLDEIAVARAELREETGLRADTLTYLGRVHVAYGYSNQVCHVFRAENLVQGEPHREATEADMVQRWVSRPQLDAMVRDGHFVDASSLAALALLERSDFLNRSGSPMPPRNDPRRGTR